MTIPNIGIQSYLLLTIIRKQKYLCPLKCVNMVFSFHVTFLDTILLRGSQQWVPNVLVGLLEIDSHLWPGLEKVDP